MDEKINLRIRNTNEYNDVEKELMDVIKKYELSYVEAFGLLETLKLQIGDAFLSVDGE